MLERPELIVVDLDGTLVDTVPDLAFCVDEMMRRLDLPTRGVASVRHWVGNGVERLVRRALSNQLDGEPEEAVMARAYPIFLELYQEHNGKYSQPFAGVREGLAWLQTQGFPLACITNKAERFTLPLLAALELDRAFSLIVSGDSLPVKKPDPGPLLYVAHHFDVEPASALMLGDSISDVAAARAAGFGSVVCVSYGYNHGEDIRSAQPNAVIDSFTELANLLEGRAL